MPRPKTKSELIAASNKNYNHLMAHIDNMTEKEKSEEFVNGPMNRNIRDVLTHLHHWHMMLLEWYRIGMSGEKPDMPAKGYTWKTTPKLNKKIWEKSQNTSFPRARKSLLESFNKVQEIISQHTDQELFEKKRYKWTGSTSLGSYLVSVTSSHYDWAYKLIKRVHKSTANSKV